MAELYYEGTNQFIDQDIEKGNYYLIRAIRQQDEEAEVYASKISYDGLYDSEVDQIKAISALSDNNSTAALEFLEQKAIDGNTDALEMLAVKYILNPSLSSRSEGLVSEEVLYRVSNSWMEFYFLSDQISVLSAANNGNPSAQNALGNIFNMGASGRMIGCDIQFAGQCEEQFGYEEQQLNPEYWLSRAAAQSHPEGLYSYGMLFIDGAFVEKDLARGVSLLFSSLESGYDSASSVLNRILDSELFDQLIELDSVEVTEALYNFLRKYEGTDTNLLSVADSYFSQTKYGSILEAIPQDSPAETGDVVDDLKELSDLFDRGLLTADEFASAKTLLLNK
jgi:TPR repeat protein